MYWNLKRAMGLLVGIGFALSIVYYAYYQSRDIIAGPAIALATPLDGQEFRDPLVRVEGRVERAKEITLDGRPIFVDLSGNFAEKLLLYPGYNIILLAAKDAEGREVTQEIRVVYSGTSTDALSPVSPLLSTSERTITQ
jgi:hypothetical protein